MSNPTEDEINKVIANFELLELTFENCPEQYGVFRKFGKDERMTKKLYTRSLDRLVPVVEKLGRNRIFSIDFDRNTDAYPNIWHVDHWIDGYGVDHDYPGVTSDKSPSMALALACYKIIKGNSNV